MDSKRIVFEAENTIVYKGMEIEASVLDSILDTNKRLLWAFVLGVNGDVRAVPYDESHVIWMAEKDVLKEQDVEI